MDGGSPLVSASFGLVFLAIDFFNLTEPLGFSFLEGNFLPPAVSAKLRSELEAMEARCRSQPQYRVRMLSKAHLFC